MVAKGGPNKTGSPRVEVGEIDTSAPFQSVKDAVNLFGEGAFSGEKITIKKIKPHSAERALMKETKLHLAQKEINKLKERLHIAEISKSDALTELIHAKRTVDDLTKKLEITNEAKKAAENQAKHFESRETNPNISFKHLENTRQRYAAMFTELNAAKLELRGIRHDRETAIGEQNDAIEHVKLVTVEAQQEHEKVFAEKKVQKLAHKAALEESAKKLLALREQVDLEMSKDLGTQFAETTTDIKRLQTEMESARATDLDSLKTVTSELVDAKDSLQQVVEEESSLNKLLESLKIELESIKKEHEELKQKEAKTESVKFTGASDEMMLTFQQLIAENENAKRQSEEMKEKADELKKEAEATKIALEEAESKLKIALTEADEAKQAESKALDDMKAISESTDAARASTSESGSNIMISSKELEALSREVVELDKEAVKKLEATQKEIDDLKVATEAALKRAEMAETCRKAVEGELKRLREREQKKAAETVAMILQETQMQQTQTPSLSSTPNYKQSPPRKQKRKKLLISKLSGLFYRKKSQVDAGSSPSYLPGEKPV